MQAVPFGLFGASIANPVNATETIILTSTPTAVPRESSAALVFLMVNGTMGNSATGIRVRLYRGPALTSPLVFDSGNLVDGIVALGIIARTFTLIDTLLALATIQYSMSVAVAGLGSSTALTNCAILGLMMG